MTTTFAKLEVNKVFFDTVAAKLKAAGYDHAFIGDAIVMHGIGLVCESRESAFFSAAPEPMPTYEEAVEMHKTGASTPLSRFIQDNEPAEIDDEQKFRDGLAEVIESAAPEPFQGRVKPWMMACFGEEISNDRMERNHRFLEESIELVQACGCTQSEAHQLVDYVFGRDQGDINQEVGGVMVTLAALCLANGYDMHAAGETELIRIWSLVEKIRAKQAAKPKHSPLPEAQQQIGVPPLDSEVRWILGRPSFQIIGLANALRKGGTEIPAKAEEEQAAVAHWCLTLYAQHGKHWREEAVKAATAMREGQPA